SRWQYTIHDSGGTSRNYQLIWGTYTVHNPIEDNSDTITVIKQINLPNGRSYVFDYCHDQGFLTKVTLPSGGFLAFDYVNGNSDHDVADNYVVARRVSADGSSTTVEWTYTRDASGSNRVVTETDPVANADDFVVVHTFASDGYEIQTAWKNNSSAD